jgi:hypothetical protein
MLVYQRRCIAANLHEKACQGGYSGGCHNLNLIKK